MVSPFLPPAPTPPVNNSSHTMASNRDRNAGLLNLLKFSGGQASQPPHLDDQHHDSSNTFHHQLPAPSAYAQHQPGFQGHNQQPQQQQQQQQPQQQHPTNEDAEALNFSSSRQPPLLAPAPTSADPTGLLAALMRGGRAVDEQDEDQLDHHHMAAVPPTAPASSSFGHSSPPSNTRAYLLNLLNQPKPSQDDQQYHPEPHSANLTPQSADMSDINRGLPAHTQGMGYGNQSNATSGSFDYEQRGQEQRFSGYNGFPMANSGHEQAAHNSFQQTTMNPGMNTWGYGGQPSEHSAPGSYGGQSHTDHQSASGAYQILKKPRASESPSTHQDPPDSIRHSHDRSPRLSPEQSRRKTDYVPSPDSANGEYMPGARQVPSGPSSPGKEDNAADDDFQETGRESPDRPALPEQEKAEAETAEDLDYPVNNAEPVAEQSAGSVNEPSREEVNGAQDQQADNAEDDREMNPDAVADSWDSADPEDAALVEEEPQAPIKVYNFPMQPWISITMTDGGSEQRPEFREGAIMDIARLKKEFDQIDRNLFTASLHCMAYGMSKAGGMHVIRQDDGKDVRIFANTKDRIFNIHMSVTPSDHTGIHREAIMGTGVSGTVYWVQILEGDKDHIEDAHPEQYGFALPPLNSQEGDTSGGVLKTRARMSSSHPEFFAVGRGKSITIVWPYLVMQKNLLKPGHDRVVDAEKLAKHCSLKINTGKAGKDFTFSQDDSVIVSLDKSGRVKFWDVRDLTVAKEDGDPNRPVPAHSSLDVKDPLMTLASTPEGEKAWPTSVLLLDKIKPYQKRCALRYMIVGMKQNHTLQLWDLALGKPVQEFNLPHSKESDAVCSVNYNPATGMIVIGHPTRNSVYLAHLSAPKYTFKNISQADYITRLGAKDPSLPAPDTTAVISGIREYSFANRGVLRSLDMLSSPAMAQDGEEPTLFELYAMHSKGAACVLIRQAELGWSKENKVIDGVEAVKAEVVTVSPLKPLGPQPFDEPIQPKQTPRAPKESSQPVAQQEESARKPADSASPVKIQTKKDLENTPGPSTPAAVPEKAEKKGRKKKNAAAQAADTQTNGMPPATPAKGNAAKGGDAPRGAAASQKALGPTVSLEAIDSTVKSMEARLNTTISGVVDSAVNGLNKTLLDREADFDSRQLKLLDVVSDVLNQNVQGVLGDIISKQFTGSVIPSIADATSKAAAEQVSIKAAHSISKELNKALPTIGEKILMDEGLVDALCDKITARVSAQVHDDVMRSLSTNLIPTLTNLTVQTSHQVAGEIQQQYQEELDRLQAKSRAEANKVDQLLSLVSRLSDTVSTMAASQSQFQGEFLKFQQHVAVEREHHARQGPGASATESPSYGMAQQAPMVPQHQPHQHPPHQHQHQPLQHHQHQHQGRHQPAQGPHESPSSQPRGLSGIDMELAHHINAIDQSVKEQRLEEAIIRWLQSGHEDEIFARYWCKLSPVHLRELPPLVQLSVATTVSQHLDTALARQKTAWLEMSVHCLLTSLPTFDQQVREVTPNIMKLVISRSENMFLRITAKDRQDPILKNLSQLVTTAKRILEATTTNSQY